MAAYSNILAWRIPWTEDLDRLPSMGSRGVSSSHYTSNGFRVVVIGNGRKAAAC